MQSLLNATNGSSGNSSLSSLIDVNALVQPLMPYLITLSIVSCIITLLYAVSIIQKWRANKAIIETRDILREMNERQKAAADPSQLTASETAVKSVEPSTTVAVSQD